MHTRLNVVILWPKTARKVNFKTRTLVRLSKFLLKGARVVAQVDRKYILATVEPDKSSSSTQLILIDQNAASERFILEELLHEICRQDSTDKSSQPSIESRLGRASSINTVEMKKKMSFQASISEWPQTVAVAPLLARWGVLYDVEPLPSEEPRRTLMQVMVMSLPPGIAQRCIAEPKLVEHLLCKEAQRLEGSTIRPLPCESNDLEDLGPDESRCWVKRIGECPRGIIDLLNSRACRSAIMFNDLLSLQECQTLVGKLARCSFPFIYAHGRVGIGATSCSESCHDWRCVCYVGR